MKQFVNIIGTPAIGYWLWGWPGVAISYLPDIFIAPIKIKDWLFGYDERRFKGLLAAGHLFFHSAWFVVLVFISGWLGVPAEVRGILYCHLTIDYLTHEDPIYVPFYPFVF